MSRIPQNSPQLSKANKAAPPRDWLRIIYLVLAFSVLVTFGSIAAHEWTTWDDNFTIWHNPRLNPVTLNSLLFYFRHSQAGLYIPLTYAYWAALCHFAQLDSPDALGATLNPWVFHAGSIVLHLIATLEIFAILRRLLALRNGANDPNPATQSIGTQSAATQWAAAIGAMVFALHPVQVETVAWAAGAKDLLAGVFTFAAIIFYLRYAAPMAPTIPGRRRLWYACAMLASIAGMLCKPSAITVILLLAIIDRLLLRRSRRTITMALWPWMLIAVLCGIEAHHAQTTRPHSGLLVRPLLALDDLAFYFYKLVWPSWLTYDYDRNPHFVIEHGDLFWTPLIPLLLALLLWRSNAATRRWLGAAWLLMVAALTPVLGLVAFEFQAQSSVADHYLYAAMLGPALAVAWLLRHPRSMAVYCFCGIVLLAWAARSAIQAETWRDSRALFGHNLQYFPDNVIALNDLATADTHEGDLTDAATLYQRAIALSPNWDTAHSNLARVLASLGDLDGAIGEMRKAITLQSQPGAEQIPDAQDHLDRYLALRAAAIKSAAMKSAATKSATTHP